MTTPEELAAMPLETFATAGLVVEVDSAVVGKCLFVSDNVPTSSLKRQKWVGRVVYRAKELDMIAEARMPAPELLRAHQVKAEFEGWIESVGPPIEKPKEPRQRSLF